VNDVEAKQQQADGKKKEKIAEEGGRNLKKKIT